MASNRNRTESLVPLDELDELTNATHVSPRMPSFWWRGTWLDDLHRGGRVHPVNVEDESSIEAFL